MFLKTLFQTEKKVLNWVNIIFCSDEYLLRLNQVYLDHDYYTDTISFILSEAGEGVAGEAYLSIDRIKSNAHERGISLDNEVLRVIIHSCLHLCGYLDQSKKRKKKMDDLQENYLNKWFVSRETQIGQ